MQIEFKHDPDQTEPKLTITAADLTDEIAGLLRQLEHGRPERWPPAWAVTAFQDERVLLLRPEDILCFYAEDKGVKAQTGEDAYTVRERLYELEERLDPRTFVRISHSEIVNLRKVTDLDLTLSGTIKMTLAGGTACYVSRRYVKKIKQALGL